MRDASQNAGTGSTTSGANGRVANASPRRDSTSSRSWRQPARIGGAPGVARVPARGVVGGQAAVAFGERAARMAEASKAAWMVAVRSFASSIPSAWIASAERSVEVWQRSS